MELQPRLKPFALLLCLGTLAALSVWPSATAQQTTNQEMTPVLLMEETAKPAASETVQLEPLVPTLDLETPPVSSDAVIPTKNLKEMTSNETTETTPVDSNTTGSPISTVNTTSNTSAATAKPETHNCHFASQLNLTHNQKFLLRHWKASFATDNRAAFDSIRIKRTLLKRLGKHPAPGRDLEQSEELKAQIHQELKALQAKREAQIAHVLNEAQYEKWQALRQECQPQAQPVTPGIIFNRNPIEEQINATLHSYPKPKY